MKAFRFIMIALLLAMSSQVLPESDRETDDAAVKAALDSQDRMLEHILNGDAEAFGELISEEFVASDPSNTIRHRDDLIALVASGRLKYESIDTSIDYADQLGDDLVVVMGTESTSQSAVPVDGELRNTALSNTLIRRFTNVYRKEQGVWRLLIKQSTIIAIE
jgi:hypothetical protein